MLEVVAHAFAGDGLAVLHQRLALGVQFARVGVQLDMAGRQLHRAVVQPRRAAQVHGAVDHVWARLVLDVALERSPSNVELMMELARLENEGGDRERAIELARAVLEYRPQDRQAQRLLELLGEESDNLDWMRSESELWEMAAGAPPGEPAVAVLDHREIRFLPSNLTEEKVQQAFLVSIGGPRP